jgi:hypothetical protein
LAILAVNLHPRAEGELKSLALSDNEAEQEAAAQLIALLDLMRSSVHIYDRLCTHHEEILVRDLAGKLITVNIKIIQSLKDCANDRRYHVDAMRRIRELHQPPGDDYRVFFAPRPSRRGPIVCEVLGIFHRSEAYSAATLAELKRRYENPSK